MERSRVCSDRRAGYCIDRHRRNKWQQREVSIEITVVLGADGRGSERCLRIRRRKESRLFVFQDRGCASLNPQLSLGEYLAGKGAAGRGLNAPKKRIRYKLIGGR